MKHDWPQQSLFEPERWSLLCVALHMALFKITPLHFVSKPFDSNPQHQFPPTHGCRSHDVQQAGSLDNKTYSEGDRAFIWLY